MAAIPPAQGRRFRFGAFELNVRSGELRKHGIRIRLAEQPLQILLMLLDNPGEVVLREEIRRRLWPNNTVVEFDHGINVAIQKLRDALGESADRPRYVETVARRGYRFLGNVERKGEPAVALSAVAPFAAIGANQTDIDKVVSHYRILGRLGEGGMGVVYRAQDLRLGRQVAVKFLAGKAGELPASIRRRFEREARSASVLNHPNICTIYGLEEIDGQPAIVMELVEGDTLAERLAKGPIRPDEILQTALQIADALTEAHRRGIVHRDLKPANIMLAKSGAKILDFGLAKSIRPVVTSAEAANVTQEGSIVGTLHYMSPEQVQGKEADTRSDIFSFGVVLYEMLTGRRAFDGQSSASVMAAILEREVPPTTNASLDRVVTGCLAKDPEQRFQSARDLKRAIEWHLVPEAANGRTRLVLNKWALWAVVGGVMSLGLFIWLRTSQSVGTLPRLQLAIVPGSMSPLPPISNSAATPQISPDASAVLYRAVGEVWVRRLDSLEPELLRGLPPATGVPFWSPDAIMAAVPTQRGLIRVRVSNGVSEVITPRIGPTRGSSWSESGTILISAYNSRLCIVPSTGGELKCLDVPGMKPGAYLWPQFLPGGRDFLFLLIPDESQRGEVYLATLKNGKVVNPTLLMENDTAAAYTPAGGGRLLFVRNDNLYCQRLDRNARRLTGEAEVVQRGIASIPGDSMNFACFSVSRSGVVAWRSGKATLNQVTIFLRNGQVTGTAGPPGSFQSVALSPDESRLLTSGGGGGSGKSSILEPLQAGSLSLGPYWNWSIWLPDGLQVLGERGSSLTIGERSLSGSVKLRELGPGLGDLEDVSPDGHFILSLCQDGTRLLRLDGYHLEQVPGFLVEGATAAGFSPDGGWIVYRIAGSGIFVQPFQRPGLRIQISNSIGFPIWRKDGKEIVFATDKDMWSVSVETSGNGLRFGAPKLLFTGLRFPAGYNGAVRPLAVSRDGSRIYFSQALEQSDAAVINIKFGLANQ